MPRRGVRSAHDGSACAGRDAHVSRGKPTPGVTVVRPRFRARTVSTTSLKLPDDVKQRITAVAKEQGITPHAFMLDSIRSATVRAEKRAALVAEALAARQAAVTSGTGYLADEVHDYLRAKTSGKAPPAPRARTWRN